MLNGNEGSDTKRVEEKQFKTMPGKEILHLRKKWCETGKRQQDQRCKLILHTKLTNVIL